MLQPPYPADGSEAAALACLRWMSERVAGLAAGGQDVVLLPEYANAPGLDGQDAALGFAAGPGAEFVAEMAAAAGRLKCMVALAVLAQSGERRFNRTLLYGPDGKLVFTCDKAHLTDAEREEFGLTPGAAPAVVEACGVRIGFGVCLDMYFPEHFEALAAQHADIVLCPSYQRSESAHRIRLLAQARALDSGAYVVRSSYYMGAPDTGGHSLVAAPTGELAAEAEPCACVLRAEIDPKAKFFKPASHGRAPVEHRAFLEAHRRPAAYRPRHDRAARLASAAFPRLCAHRGLSRACPENTLPAFAAAMAAGAEEMEFDLWMSRDGVAVVCHDPTIDRTTDGTGRITDLSWPEIRRADAGVKQGWYRADDSLIRPDVKFNEAWRGTRIPRFEEVLELTDGRIGLNIHIKDAGPDGRLVKLVCDMLREQALLDIAYIAGCTEAVLRTARDYAPEVKRACLLGQRGDVSVQVELALKFGCERIQIWGGVTEQGIRRAHEAGLVCNYFWADDPAEAGELVQKGIDVILTNCPHTLRAAGFPAADSSRP